MSSTPGPDVATSEVERCLGGKGGRGFVVEEGFL